VVRPDDSLILRIGRVFQDSKSLATLLHKLTKKIIYLSLGPWRSLAHVNSALSSRCDESARYPDAILKNAFPEALSDVRTNESRHPLYCTG